MCTAYFVVACRKRLLEKEVPEEQGINKQAVAAVVITVALAIIMITYIAGEYGKPVGSRGAISRSTLKQKQRNAFSVRVKHFEGVEQPV